ncbi:TetR/AcrR family transcriptional regulator [Streptomyces sp. NPDC059076]|uniref:TetR/AcrR family transcriptional regulator n=1 Tax=unclassified Streptomyces TaxID=2593676 RepID=UPI003682CB2D
MPTGVAIRDPREQLFNAAERVLLRDGPSALTSRAVTTEAGCAKGVLHRHFTDFDAFLAELVRDRIARLDATALLASAGTGAVCDHLTVALTDLFESVAVAIVSLVISRDELRVRLRPTTPTGIPVLTEAAAMLGSYLAAERELGRIDAGCDLHVLAATLIGAAHMLFADRTGTPPDSTAVRRVVDSVIVGALSTPPPSTALSRRTPMDRVGNRKARPAAD